MRIIISLLALIQFSLQLSAQVYMKPNFEVISNDVQYFKTEKLGFSEQTNDLPNKYSLKSSCPMPIVQDGQSCVGFSVAYYTMSIMHNFLNGRSLNERIVDCFDPYFIYGSVHNSKAEGCNPCNCGSMITDALDLIQNFGCKKMNVNPNFSCDSEVSYQQLKSNSKLSRNYTVDEYYSLLEYGINSANEYYPIIELEDIKFALSKDYPIIAGISIQEEFMELDEYSNNYKPKRGGQVLGGHAITIIGFDDNKYGGAVEFINSYGMEWGDNGFGWIPYSELKQILDEAYILHNNNWDNWTNDFQYDNYIRYTNDNGGIYEGNINENGYFHSTSCIEIYPNDFAGTGAYVNGQRDGKWYIFSHENVPQEEALWGWILFDAGEAVDAESFGFAKIEKSQMDILSEKINLITSTVYSNGISHNILNSVNPPKRIKD